MTFDTIAIGSGQAGDVRVDFPAIIARKDSVAKSWQGGVAHRIDAAAPRLTLARGHARLVGARAIEVTGDRHQAPAIVLTTRARPIQPDIRGLPGVPWLDNRRVAAGLQSVAMALPRYALS